MKLLEKAKEAGFKVSDIRTKAGDRIIGITWYGGFIRCIFPANCDLQTAKYRIAFLQQRISSLCNK